MILRVYDRVQRQVVNRDKTIAPSATLLLYAAAFTVTLAVHGE